MKITIVNNDAHAVRVRFAQPSVVKDDTVFINVFSETKR
jgi:hypothetical protein